MGPTAAAAPPRPRLVRAAPAAIAFRSRHATDRTSLAFGRDTLDVPDTPRTLAEDREVITALLAAGVTVPERWLDDLDRTDPR